MGATRTILAIAGIGTLFFQELLLEADFTSATSQSEKAVVNPHFHWNWKAWQELSAEQSLRKAKLTYKRRKAIAGAIADQIRPMMADLEIQSETELQKVALDTRVKMIDLNGDGVPEVVAQRMVNYGATGNWLRAQPVDATPCSQLIRQHFPMDEGCVRL